MAKSALVSFKTLPIVFNDLDNLPNLKIRNNLNNLRILSTRRSNGIRNGKKNGRIENKSINPNLDEINFTLLENGFLDWY